MDRLMTQSLPVTRSWPKRLKGLRRAYRRSWWISSYFNALGAWQSYFWDRPVTRTREPLPWMTYPAIEYLRQLDLSASFVFEYGSGHGSLFWSARARRVVSVEDNLAWIEELRPKCAPNQTIVFAARPDEYVQAISGLDQPPDLIIIDGKYRYSCARYAVQAVPQCPMIVLDNSDWLPRTCGFLTESGFAQFDFIGPSPLNAFASATSVFVRAPERVIARNSLAPLVIGGNPKVIDEG
jgi:hypothetical protein